jgi:ribosomal protein S12 methylthiotransferase accessory factor
MTDLDDRMTDLDDTPRMHALAWLENTTDDTTMLPCGTSHRSVPAADAVAKVWPLRHRLGISRVTDLTPLDVVGIPVFSVTRPQARTGQITLCQGKGNTPVEALASALFEAVERHCGSLARPTLTARPTELRAAGRTHRPRRTWAWPSLCPISRSSGSRAGTAGPAAPCCCPPPR